MTSIVKAFKLFRKLVVYKVKSRHRKGFGIHSPFLFALVNKDFRKECSDTVIEGAARYKQALGSLNYAIPRSNLGAGSLLSSKGKAATPATINKYIGITRKYGELLHKFSKVYGGNNILELGTGLGNSTYYLATGSPKAKVITVEGHNEYMSIAKNLLTQVGINNIEYKTGSFENELEELKKGQVTFGLFYIDGDHTFTSTMRNLEKCLEIATEDAVIILDDIHWSDEMDSAWSAIKAHSKCQVSIDLFRFGVVFTNTKFQKQHYIVRY